MNENRAIKYKYVEEKIRIKIIYLPFLFVMPILALYFHIEKREEILDSFNTNKKLICKVGNINIDISKDDSWKYEDYYFIKNLTKIVTTKCEVK